MKAAVSDIHFYDLEVPELLLKAIKLKSSSPFSIIDLGCGDGRILLALKVKGLLNNATKIVGVDISPSRIPVLKNYIKEAIGIVSDACNVKELENECFDIVICSQVVEHVHNDKELAREIARWLKPSGLAYVSSVIKSKGAVSLYRREGSFRLDPTHIQEYSSTTQFVDVPNPCYMSKWS